MSIFEHSLESFKEIPVKHCREVSFCNGGHLVAIVNSTMIDIYNFYTGDNP